STHQLAFHDFLEVAREQATALTLQAGSVLIIRNTAINNGTASDSQRFVMALHGRNPFAPNWEQPRILKRVFVRGQPYFSR
ncbi:MAG TPA: hypothetical protein VLF20_01800, partial [Patescibacteria group bacterium]|nr:hypothetical protein [Patescibacteria group bacterium]